MSDSTTPMPGHDEPRATVRPEHPVQVHPTLRLSVDPPDDDEFDALADLFLGEDEPAPADETTLPPTTRPTPAPIAATPTIEAIVLGHLPVLASAWVRQYAAHRANELGGPVVLIRVRASGTSVERLPAGPIDRCERLSDALAVSVPGAAGVVLQVDETAEPELGAIAQLDAITMLSGTDEAATVASYRVIKALAAQSTCELRVVLMGSEPDAASRTFARIERAAASILDQPLTFGGSVHRIDAPRATTIYRGPTDQQLAGVLELIADAQAVPADGQASVQTTPPADRLVPMPPAEPAAPTRPGPDEAAPRSARSARSRSTSAAVAPHAGNATSNPVRLAELLEGLSPIELACPHALAVELASDASGALHLLAYDELGPRGPLESLAIAAAWATTNSQLLLAAAPALTGPVEPIEHLFVAQPSAVRHLLDAPIRLHLLASVAVENRRAWCEAPLN